MSKPKKTDNLIVAEQKRSKKKLLTSAIVFLIFTVLIATVVIGITNAWFVSSNTNLQQTVSVNKVGASLLYKSANSNDYSEFPDSFKNSELNNSVISVNNENDSSVYIKVKLFFETSSGDNKVLPTADYTVTYDTKKWTLKSDGYYYYNSIVSGINTDPIPFITGITSNASDNNTTIIVATVECVQPDRAQEFGFVMSKQEADK